jgi:hypothetical protein
MTHSEHSNRIKNQNFTKNKKKIKKEGVDYCDAPHIKEKVKTPPVFVIAFTVYATPDV